MRRELRRNLECDGKWGLKDHLRERLVEWERERERERRKETCEIKVFWYLFVNLQKKKLVKYDY